MLVGGTDLSEEIEHLRLLKMTRACVSCETRVQTQTSATDTRLASVVCSLCRISTCLAGASAPHDGHAFDFVTHDTKRLETIKKVMREQGP